MMHFYSSSAFTSVTSLVAELQYLSGRVSKCEIRRGEM